MYLAKYVVGAIALSAIFLTTPVIATQNTHQNDVAFGIHVNTGGGYYHHWGGGPYYHNYYRPHYYNYYPYQYQYYYYPYQYNDWYWDSW